MTFQAASGQSPFTSLVEPLSPASWSHLLAEFDDASVYQSHAYGAVRWGEKNLVHFSLQRDGQTVAAAQLRIAKLPLLPAGIAYLRWGPLLQPKGRPFDPTVASAMLAALRDEFCRQRGLTLQILPNAYPGTAAYAALSASLATLGFSPDPSLDLYRTIRLDLSPPTETLRKQLDSKWRNQLNRSEKNGLVITHNDSAAAYQEFIRLYGPMQSRKQFDSPVNVEEFARIHELLPPGSKLETFLAQKDGETIGTVVVAIAGDTAIYLLGATNEKAREHKASYLLHWQVILWLQERGVRWYDLGGIDPAENPGGYHFKAGFGGADVTQLPPHTLPGNFLSRAITSYVSRRKIKSGPPSVSTSPGR